MVWLLHIYIHIENLDTQMKTISQKFFVALAATAFAAISAHASTITVSTGFSGSGPMATATDYQSTVEAAIAAPTPGYGSTTVAVFDNLSNQSLFGSNTNIAYKYNVDFNVSDATVGDWDFRAGLDFGAG